MRNRQSPSPLCLLSYQWKGQMIKLPWTPGTEVVATNVLEFDPKPRHLSLSPNLGIKATPQHEIISQQKISEEEETVVGSTCGWGRGPANMFSVGSYEDKKQRYRIINNANESYTIQKIDWQLLSTQIYVHGKFNSISFNKAINCFHFYRFICIFCKIVINVVVEIVCVPMV